MSKTSEIEEWQNAARRYRQLALMATVRSSRKLLERLAVEAEAMAEDIADREALPRKPSVGS
jgi:hypothetical protein